MTRRCEPAADRELSLRQRAEALGPTGVALAAEDVAQMSDLDAQELLSELRVHQVELEMQNEELRKTVLELDVSRQRYWELYERAPTGYCTVDESGLISQANLTTASLLGVTRNQLIKRPINRFIAMPDQDIYHRLRQQIVATGVSGACELRMLKSAGTIIWVRLEAVALSDESSALNIVLSEITERKQMFAALQASEIKYRTLMEHAAEAVVVADMEGNVLEINAQAVALLGYARDELIGRNVSRFHPQVEMPLITESFIKCDRLDRVETTLCHVLTRQGLRVPVRIAAIGITVAGCKVVMGIFHDLSLQQQSEVQRLRAERRHRDALVREVHHRIKNSLQGMTGLLHDAARRQPELAPTIHEVIGQVSSIALVHGLYGEHSDGQISLCDLVTDIASNAATLWRMKTPITIKGDCQRRMLKECEAEPLALVLNELLANACKHGQSGRASAKSWASIEITVAGLQARVCISNPGQLPPGFDFERREGLGTGLNLVALLLPKNDASLEWTQQQGSVLVQLTLLAPFFAEQALADGASA